MWETFIFRHLLKPFRGAMVEASEIFYGFCKMFSSLGITSIPTPSTWKYRVYYFFDNLGRMLGYEVLTEDTFREKEGFKKLARKRIDMTWMTPDLSEYVMALEYQNTKAINNDIAKLAAMLGLRILVTFRYDLADKEIIEKIKREEKRYQRKDGFFLVLILPNTFKKRGPFEKIKAILLDSKGKISGSGSAQGYVGRDGVCAFRNIIWTT